MFASSATLGGMLSGDVPLMSSFEVLSFQSQRNLSGCFGGRGWDGASQVHLA